MFFCNVFIPEAIAIQAVVTCNIYHTPTADRSLTPYVEVYWEIDPASIRFLRAGGVWTGSIITELTLRKDTMIIAREAYILQTTPYENPEDALHQKILELKRLSVPYGELEMHLKLTDRETRQTFETQKSITIKDHKDSVFFSDIQMTDTLIPGAGHENHVFYRNGFLQFPIPGDFIDDHRKTLRYYAEVYNTHIPDSAEILIRKVFISRKELQPALHDLLVSDTMPHGSVQVISGSFSVRTLPSGNYYLNMTLENARGKTLASRSRFFQLINTDPQPLSEATSPDTAHAAAAETEGPTYLNLQKTFLAKYSMPQIRAILKMLYPVATLQEKKTLNEFLRKPDDMYSRYFIYNFWLSRDRKNPESAWKAYAEKVKEVNKLFGSRNLAGYETDRGIVYLKYGAPTERIIVLNEPGALPYEIWQYNVMEYQANGLFLFYRESILANDFLLLHTTVSGEVQNRSWRKNLYTHGENIQNSRADQYIGSR